MIIINNIVYIKLTKIIYNYVLLLLSIKNTISIYRLLIGRGEIIIYIDLNEEFHEIFSLLPNTNAEIKWVFSSLCFFKK